MKTFVTAAILAATALPAFATELTVWDWKSGDPLAASCCQQPKIPAAGGDWPVTTGISIAEFEP